MDDIDKLTANKTVDQMIEDAHTEISALCHGKQWRMSIPVQADDSDIVLGNALRAAKNRIEKLEAALRLALNPTTPSDFVLAQKVLEDGGQNARS